MLNFLTQNLLALARRLTNASTGFRTNNLVSRFESTMQDQMLAAENLAVFADTSEQEFMLADEARVNTYATAIARHVGADDTVLDLGAGTGILSFLAARKAKKVYAVEHSEVIEAAQAVGEANGFSNIEYIRSNSRDFTPPEPVDVILHEQIGDELLDENVILNVVDLRTRVLRPGGRIVPALFELYAEPICLFDEYSTPFVWQMNIHGIDYSCLADHDEYGSERHWDKRWLHRREFDHLLCEPEPVYHLDLMTVDADDLPTSFSAKKTVTTPGRIDGIIIYLRIMFDEDTDLNTSPSVLTSSSWGNRFFRVPPRFLELGERIDFHIDAPEVRNFDTWNLWVTRPDLFSTESST